MERTLETITINNALEVVRLKGELKFKHPLGYTRPSGYCFKHPVKGFNHSTKYLSGVAVLLPRYYRGGYYGFWKI